MFRILLFISCCFTVPLSQARTVTDHSGNIVNVPDAPRRIVSLHDWTLTVMTHELGTPLIASTGRLAADGSQYMRGARDLFGLDFSQIALASIHGKLDLERLRALKPDLILANTGDYAALRSPLSSIAPTLLFNPEQGRPMLDLYQDLADWLGKRAEFDALRQRYTAQATALRNRLDVPGTYVALLVNGRDGTIQILKEYGALTTVMDDLGLRRMPIVETIPAGTDRMTIGAELIESIDADYIVTSYLSDQGEDAQSIEQDFDRIAPGARGFLQAFVNQRVLRFSRYEVYPPSFKGLEMTLKNVESAIAAK
ncbi:ABC-type Fe3+-hydroxamate transport system substrate-binding protein|uniref:ABC-type Fe3+-hydroxamate transport system substrate-binding protein n=1 Tax=Brenneria salicis ATCC 15712 = DSM 30166 TaxID=714314 RepID=A0A366I6P2_9GAMM|nr:ABC transporter substrate-binding protein [Brenneria salicis]NMN91903.1 ABC-type Fe3+-hydroxamate transport system substrate-binding protein [Brenneria salicis ATCC 15712 = DSM 30166]RBP62877.1 ABC-type Fe3+-hydroxamate transport system substrate-binding protein [Brenneria salicis ATCC 15712 = DSM 30166]RLM30742.1 hypothetical protein BHG07_09220 [Brenneria salicis ATCC 15712 = DSM 30166]